MTRRVTLHRTLRPWHARHPHLASAALVLCVAALALGAGYAIYSVIGFGMTH